MGDDAVRAARSRHDDTDLCLNVDHWYVCQAAALLESVGGDRFLPADGMVYRFVTGAARDEALDLVRRRFGWTVAIPRDDSHRMAGRRPWDAASRIGWNDLALGSAALS
jgi:hypothetical protein